MYYKKKTRTKVKANFIIYDNFYKLAKLVTNAWRYIIIDITDDSNNQNNNDYKNIKLAEFGINMKILFIRKTRYR